MERLSAPRSGSTSRKFGTGGTRPVSSALIATTSSMPTPIGWPVKPLVLAITICVGVCRRTRGAARGSRRRRCRRARACRSRARRTRSRARSRRAATPRASAWRDDVLHHAADVRRRRAAMPWKAQLAVTAPSTSQIGRDAALARGRGALDDDAGRAHAEDHPVAAPVERQRGLLDDLVGGRGAGGQEARAEPPQQRVGGHVVGGHDHDAPAAARADPVLGDRDGLRRARARGVDLRVRPARADQLGELGVAHGEHAEQEAAVEVVRLRLEVALELVDAAVDLVARRRRRRARSRTSRSASSARALHALGPERARCPRRSRS